jgi:hypothetical protein
LRRTAFSHPAGHGTSNPIEAKKGDIIEISTPEGLAFAQYTYKHPQYGELLNVLPGVSAAAPDDFDGLLKEEPQFTTFFSLREPPCDNKPDDPGRGLLKCR